MTTPRRRRTRRPGSRTSRSSSAAAPAESSSCPASPGARPRRWTRSGCRCRCPARTSIRWTSATPISRTSPPTRTWCFSTMKKQITLALAALALLTGGILTRSWAVSWPQSAFREWQTGFNPVETLLTPLPDVYWWSQDVSVTDLALARGREWSPVAIDFGIQGLPDPIIAVGRRNELVFYHPNLPQGLSAGAALPVGTVTFPGTGGAATETGILTTNPVTAISPAAPTSTTATPAQPTPGQP